MSPPESQADVLLERKFHAGWGMGREETFLVVPHDEVCTCEHVQCTRTDWDVRFMAGWLSCTPSMTDLARGNPTRRQQFRSRSLCLGGQLGDFSSPPPGEEQPSLGGTQWVFALQHLHLRARVGCVAAQFGGRPQPYPRWPRFGHATAWLTPEGLLMCVRICRFWGLTFPGQTHADRNAG